MHAIHKLYKSKKINKNYENAIKFTEKMVGMIHTKISNTYFIPIVIKIAAVAFCVHYGF